MHISLKEAVFTRQFSLVFIFALAILCYENSEADTFTRPLDKNGEFLLRFEDDVSVTFSADMELLFDSIESVCINGSIKEGNASDVFVVVPRDPVPGFQTVSLLNYFELTYNSDSSTQPEQKNIRICFNSVFPEILLDGHANFDVAVRNGYIEFWDLQVEVNGVLSHTQVDIGLINDVATVPFYGGKLKYQAKIQNLDSNESTKSFAYWSVIKLPNGDSYPVRKVKTVALAYEEKLEFYKLKVNIPEWFEAGEYELIWMTADIESAKRSQDRIKFTKE